jgi:uncharacterized membrane protein
MATPKKYLHDHIILLLLSINAAATVLGSALILLQLSGGHGSPYIVQYRPNLGINAFTSGSVTELLGFIVFMLLVLGLHTVLSMRTYGIHRQLAIVILCLGFLLLVLSILISNALLTLR